MSEFPMPKRTIIRTQISSRHLAEGQRSIRIYLPPGYNELLTYPVVYCQDGEQFFNYGRIATTAQQLIWEEGLEPFIIVGIDVDIAKRTSEYNPDGALHQRYLAFIAEELVPFMESNYRGRPDRDARILAGDSLGGSVSVHLALQYPSLFNKIICYSGAFYPTSTYLISLERDLRNLELYMIVGLQETAFTSDQGTFNFVDMNRTMRDMLMERGATIHYSEHEGDHVWGFWQQHVGASLRAFLN